MIVLRIVIGSYFGRFHQQLCYRFATVGQAIRFNLLKPNAHSQNGFKRIFTSILKAVGFEIDDF